MLKMCSFSCVAVALWLLLLLSQSFGKKLQFPIVPLRSRKHQVFIYGPRCLAECARSFHKCI